MTGPPLSQSDIGAPTRILSPDEYEHAQTLSPADLKKAQFPAVPEAIKAPKDAAYTAAGVRPPGEENRPKLTGMARILTQYVAEPLWDHPIMAVASALPPVAAYFTGAMAKDVVEYAAQKTAELSLPAYEKGLAEKDPERISGELAAVEGVFLGAAPLLHEAIKRGRAASSVPAPGEGIAGGRPEAGGTSNQVAAEAVGLEPSTQDLSRLVPEGKPGVVVEPYKPDAKIVKVTSRDAAGKPNGLLVLAKTGEKTADVFTVFVDPKARRQGIATSLYKAAEDQGFTLRSGQSGYTPEGKSFVEKRTGGPAPVSDLQKLADQTASQMTPQVARGQSIIKGHVDRVVDSWKSVFAPATRSTQAAQAASILRATTGEMARTYEQAAFKLDEFRRAVEPLSDADKLGFIDAIEGGKSQPTPEFQEAATTIRTTLDTMRDQIRALGAGKLDNFIENYFPHIWSDPERAAGAFQSLPSDPRIKIPEQRFPEKMVAESDEALAAAMQDEHGDPIVTSLARPRTQGGTLKNLAKVSDEELANEYKILNDANAQENVAPTTIDDQAGRLWQGIKPAAMKAMGRVSARAKSIAKIEAELKARGIETSDAYMQAEQRAQLSDPTSFPFGEGFAPVDEKMAVAEGAPDLMEQQVQLLQERLDKASNEAVKRSIAVRLDALDQARRRTHGRRPWAGSGAFMKHRSIPTTAEGMAMGLEPVSTNPVDLTLLKLREMQRYYMAHSSLHEMHDAGLVKYVGSGEEIPQGYTRINDKITTVFGPREGAVKLPAGANISPSDVSVPGTRIMGEYWAPEPVAKVVNNYLSPGLRGNAIYDAYRGLGNTLNQAQLGLSAFHLMFTSMDASVSRAALGLEYITGGSIGRGFREMLSAPVAPVTNLRLGAKIRSAYLDPEHASPDMQALANAVQEAGGRIRMDSFYKNSAPERMIEAWRNGEYGKAIGLSLPALFEFAAKPIMEHIVPLQKLGVFGDLAKRTMDGIPPDASLLDRRQALGDAWNSVDNRMGQLVYDNLFWNKAFKDLAMASVRSVGWNIGTIRELGGGMVDVAGSAADIARGRATEMSHKAAYVISLPLTVGFYGAIYQYLRTGEGPQEMKDYFYPKTGEQDADGNPERVQIASYMKDFFAYGGHPWQTVKHKMNPILSSTYEMLQNEEFYGDMIRNPDDPFVQQIAQEAGYVAKQVTPFSFRNMAEQSKRGDQSKVTKLGSWFGITPAPRSEVRTEAQNRMQEYLSQRRMSGATPEDAEARQSRSEILRGLRGNSDIKLGQAVTNAIERHQLTADGVVQLLKRAGLTPAQEQFKRLTLTQAVDVFKRGTRHEKELFAEALLNKVMRAQETASGP